MGLQLTTGEVSVKPYPWSVGSPIEFKNSPISLSRAPPPETKAFKFPPNCLLIFFLTNTSVIKFNNVGHISKFDVKSICNNLKKVAQDYNKLKKRDFNNVIKIHQNENISKTFKAFIYELIN